MSGRGIGETRASWLDGQDYTNAFEALLKEDGKEDDQLGHWTLPICVALLPIDTTEPAERVN